MIDKCPLCGGEVRYYDGEKENCAECTLPYVLWEEVGKLQAYKAEDAELNEEITRIMNNLPPLKPGKAFTALTQLRELLDMESGVISEVITKAVERLTALEITYDIAEQLLVAESVCHGEGQLGIPENYLKIIKETFPNLADKYIYLYQYPWE